MRSIVGYWFPIGPHGQDVHFCIATCFSVVSNPTHVVWDAVLDEFEPYLKVEAKHVCIGLYDCIHSGAEEFTIDDNLE